MEDSYTQLAHRKRKGYNRFHHIQWTSKINKTSKANISDNNYNMTETNTQNLLLLFTFALLPSSVHTHTHTTQTHTNGQRRRNRRWRGKKRDVKNVDKIFITECQPNHDTKSTSNPTLLIKGDNKMQCAVAFRQFSLSFSWNLQAWGTVLQSKNRKHIENKKK